MEIGKAIKDIRLEFRLSQGDLALKSNIAQSTVSQIERGNRKPSEKNLGKIVKALDVPEQIIYVYALKYSKIQESKKHLFDQIYPAFKTFLKEIYKK